jgi:hypothetical protein
MKQHEFTLVLTTDPSDDESNTLYGTIDDGTLSTIAGIPLFRFHRESASLEDAISSAIKQVRTAGLDVQRVELEPDAVLQTA